jgi:hypothetical protein
VRKTSSSDSSSTLCWSASWPKVEGEARKKRRRCVEGTYRACLDFKLLVVMVKAGRPAEPEARVLEQDATSGVKAVRLVDGVPLLVVSSIE